MKKTTSPNLAGKKIAIISHVFASGPAQALLEYVTRINKAAKVLFIGHPLFYQPHKKVGSYVELYVGGVQEKRRGARNFCFPSVFSYIRDLLLSLYWVIRSGEKWDLVVCADSLNALAGIILRKIGRVKKVVFYTIDYVPLRFENKILNEVYHWIDKFCVHRADEVWNLSPRMELARKKYGGIKTQPAKQKIVPMGVWFDRIKRVPFEKVEKHTLVFMGHLIEKQGVQVVIKAIPEIVREIPDFKFLVIGTGKYEYKLKEMVNNLGVAKYVQFTGYIEKYEEMINLIGRCACAVALYKEGDEKRNFTYYADPGKIKDYLAAGSPVILTNIPHNAKEIEGKKCGVIVRYNKKTVAEAIIQMMKDKEKLLAYRQNALACAEAFDWGVIFSKALKTVI